MCWFLSAYSISELKSKHAALESQVQARNDEIKVLKESIDEYQRRVEGLGVTITQHEDKQRSLEQVL